MRRKLLFLGAFVAQAVQAVANDWGMGEANSKIAPLTYSVIRFRSRPADDASEPPQIYGSGPVEFAWTTVPVLIVFVLILVTARSIYSVQAPRRPPNALAVRVVGHQWWWEFEYPDRPDHDDRLSSAEAHRVGTPPRVEPVALSEPT